MSLAISRRSRRFSLRQSLVSDVCQATMRTSRATTMTAMI